MTLADAYALMLSAIRDAENFRLRTKPAFVCLEHQEACALRDCLLTATAEQAAAAALTVTRPMSHPMIDPNA